MSKIKDEQLKKLQGLVNQTNNAQIQIGQLETQKFDLMGALSKIRDEFAKFQVELEDEYGKISINIQDGTYKEIPADESNTEN